MRPEGLRQMNLRLLLIGAVVAGSLLLSPVARAQDKAKFGLPENFDGKTAPTLNPKLLKTLPDLDKRTVPDLSKRKGTQAEADFLQLYREAMINAARVPKEAFVEYAKDFTHLTWAHLYNEAERHYGKVVTVEGKLLRLRKYDAPALLAEQDIPFIYEAWVQGPTEGSNPFALEFVHLPDGIKVAEHYDQPPVVRFWGYFLGRYRYRGGQGKDFVTHLAVGPTLSVRREPKVDAGLTLRFEKKTARIAGIEAGGPANKAGLQVGDILQKVDGREVKTAEEWNDLLCEKQPNDELSIFAQRGQEGRPVSLKLAPRVVETAKPALSPLAGLVLYGILGVVCLVTVLMVGLNWWFRKGDQEVRARLAEIQAQRAVENLEAGVMFPETGIKPASGGLPGPNGDNGPK